MLVKDIVAGKYYYHQSHFYVYVISITNRGRDCDINWSYTLIVDNSVWGEGGVLTFLADDSVSMDLVQDWKCTKCPDDKSNDYERQRSSSGVFAATKTPNQKCCIPQNARSATCVQCGKPNKVVDTGFSVLYYCPSCEP